MTFKFFRICVCLLFVCSAVPAKYLHAQNPNPSERLKDAVTEQERREVLDEVSEQRKQEKQKQIEKDSGSVGLDKNDEKIVLLKELKFSKSDVLSQSFFDELKKKYENTQVSVNDIYGIVNTVNNEYMINGYIASQAFLKEQDITSGTLFVSLVEGIISDIRVTGNKTTSEKYIRRYINLDAVENFNANVTNRDIMNFNAANDAKARIALSPGKVFGTSEVDIIIDEPKRYSLSVFTDNSGQEETGFIRYGGYATVRSLTKYRDIFTAGGVFSDGSNAAYASYEIPEPFFNTRVGAGFDYSDTQIINGGLRTLDVTGNYYNVSLYVKKPFWVGETAVSNVTFNANTRKGESFVSSFKTQDTTTDVLSLSADNTLMFSGGYIFNMISYGQGLTIINGNTSFEKLGYYGEGFYGLPWNFGVNLKFRGQLAFDTVPSSEQFSVGGMNTVRGYKEGMLMSKNGLAANAELQYDIKFIKWRIIDFARIYAFFDYGSVFSESKANLPDDYDEIIYSSGLGVKIGVFKHMDAHVVWAAPLVKHKYYDNDASSVLFIVQGKI